MHRRALYSQSLGVLLIATAALIVYLPALGGAFIWDDEGLIAKNRLVHDPGGLTRIWFSTEAIDYWPVTNTAYWLEWRLWGTETAGYHLVNLATHIGNSILVWLILRRLSIRGAFLAGLLFAVHPVNVEAVAWIAQLKSLLAMFFMLWSVYWYLIYQSASAAAGTGGLQELRSPRSAAGWWYWLSVAAFALAMLSKGSVAILPVVLLLLGWWQTRKMTKREIVNTLPFSIVAIALTAVNVWFQTHGAGEVIRSASLVDRTLTAGAALWFYLSKAVAPVGLNFVYPLWRVDAGSFIWWMPAVAAVTVTMGLWWKRHTTCGRSLFFAWIFFTVGLIPVLGFANIYFMRYSLVADHYQYIAIIALTALAAAFTSSPRSAPPGSASRLTQRNSRVHRLSFIVHRFRLQQCVALGLVIVLMALSSQQIHIYRDPITLWQTTLEKNPGCPLAATNLGCELQKIGKHSEAIEYYRAALQADPNFAEAHCGLASALAATGQLDAAMAECRCAIELQPSCAQAHNDLAGLLINRGQCAEAVDHCQQALQYNPDYAEAHNNLGLAYLISGRTSEAITEFETSLRLATDNAETHNNLANALVKAHRPGSAIAHYLVALHQKPDYLQARSNLAIAYAQANQPAAAMAAAQQAIALAESTGQTQQAERIRSWLASYRAGPSRHVDTAVRPAAAIESH